MEIKNPSGLICLKVLLAQFRRGVNFAALMTDEIQEKYQANDLDTLFKLTESQELRSEKVSSLEQVSNYNGPMLAKLNNGNWLLVINSSQIDKDNMAILDPAVGQKIISVPSAQFKENFSGTALIFRNLAQVDAAKQTKLTAFVAVAKHHNTQIDIRELMHEYAVSDEEVKDNLFRQIASDRQFKTKQTKLSWEKLQKSTTVFPCIAIKKSGKYAIFCGFRPQKDNPEIVDAVIVDPESDNFSAPDHFLFKSQEEFFEEYTGQFILLKKIYKLSDENQPFSLRWFIPEFIKNKAIFGQIALMVVMLTIFSLVIPLFFQIVVDKVLVNQAYNTLNVLGIGILLAIIVNAVDLALALPKGNDERAVIQSGSITKPCRCCCALCSCQYVRYIRCV